MIFFLLTGYLNFLNLFGGSTLLIVLQKQAKENLYETKADCFSLSRNSNFAR